MHTSLASLQFKNDSNWVQDRCEGSAIFRVAGPAALAAVATAGQAPLEMQHIGPAARSLRQLNLALQKFSTRFPSFCTQAVQFRSSCDPKTRLIYHVTRGNSFKGIISPEQCNLTNKNLVFGVIIKPRISSFK